MAIWLIAAGMSAAQPPAWSEPLEWAEVGTVSAWMDLDLRFNYGYVENLELTVARDRQRAIYERTLQYSAEIPALDLDAFLALPGSEQARRSELAQRELKLVTRLLGRLREPGTYSWHADQTDVDLMGAVLESLTNATGLEPTNPYSWHLLGWLRAQIGDLDSSTRCYDRAAKALGHIPPDQLVEVRRRLALDRAWDRRDEGHGQAAQTLVEAAEKLGGSDFETCLLLGLLAATAGEQTEAESYAKKVKNVGSYGLTHGRHLPKYVRSKLLLHSGRMAASWIEAMAWLKLGYVEQAAYVFPNWGIGQLHLPRFWFANRFWRDAGLIYHMTERPVLASTAWQLGIDLTPYRPFFVYRRYSAPPRGMAGLSERLPFVLNFGLFYGGGSRFGYALSLARDLGSHGDAAAQAQELLKVQETLFTCLRYGEFEPQTLLTLEHVFRRSGQLASANSCHEQAVQAFAVLGYVATSGPPGTMVQLSERTPHDLTQTVIRDGRTGAKVVWKDQRPVREVLDDIQDTYFADPTPENRRELARFLIRNLHIAEGRDLLVHGRGAAPGAGDEVAALGNDDLAVLLEADRAEGVMVRARLLANSLAAGTQAKPRSAEVWELVGIILLEAGERSSGLTALRRASALDPQNGGLRLQLRMMTD